MTGLDLLPYLIGSAAANAGSATLQVTAGSNGGWPALPGDTIIFAGGSGGTAPTGVTDSQGNTYTKQAQFGAAPAGSIWIAAAGAGGLKAAGPGFTADTLTVTYAATTSAKQWIALGCQGLGAVDLATTPGATGTSTTPAITSGTPAQSGELFLVLVVHVNAGGTIGDVAGWQTVAKNVTFGANSLVSVYAKVNRGASPVTFTGALTASANWSATLTSFRPSAGWASQRDRVGASIFKASYPGEVTTDAQARARFDGIMGRNSAGQGQKRYLHEGEYESQANQYQSVVSLTASGIKCMVSIKATRAVGGGVAGDLTAIAAMITYWKNNGTAPHTLLWNEANITGASGDFGDGSSPNKGPTPYWHTGDPPMTLANAASNYQDYFAFYAPTILSAGLQCFYNPAISSHASVVPFLPPRWNNGAGLCTGMTIDYYYAGDFRSNSITMDTFIASANAGTPPYPVGVGEWGATDGTTRPIQNNPAGSLAGFVSWIDAHMTAPLAAQLTGGYTLTMALYYSNGTGNAIDTTADPSIIAAYQRFYDALDVSAGAGLTVTTVSPLPGATLGTPYSATLSATGGTTPYSWSVTTGALPAGLSLNATTGQITGTPSVTGTFSIGFTVADSASHAVAGTLSLTISPAATLAIPAQALPQGTAGQPYSTTVTATGGTTPYTAWAVTAGTLPTGLTLTPTGPSGSITGTPAGAGTSAFTIRVTDTATATASRALSIVVVTTALAVTTTQLPAATLNTAYSAQLGAANGTPPYTWAVTAGALPPGLALTSGGVISGIPVASGTSSFTVQVTDNAAATATQALSITVTIIIPPVPAGAWRLLLANPQPDGTYLAEIAQAAQRTVILRTEPDQGHEAAFTVLGDIEPAAQIAEMLTDLHVLYGSQIVFCGRIAPSQDVLDAAGHHATFTAYDYREVLRRRAVLPGDTLSFTSVEQATICWNLIQATQARPGGNLGIARGTGQSTGAARTMTFALGDYIGDDITTIAQLNNGFEWQLNAYQPADLRLDIYHPWQGTSAGAVLAYGDGRVSSITRNVDPSTFANAVYETSTGLSAQFLESAAIGEGRWDKTIGASLKTASSLADSALADLAAAQALTPSYTVVCYPGTWGGPSDLWLGDTVTVQIRSGRLDVNDALRIVEMQFDLSPDNVETLTLAIGALPFRLHKKIAAVLKRLRYLESR